MRNFCPVSGKKYYYSILTAAVFSFSSFKLNYPESDSRTKALFVYNFAKYIEWPDEMQEENFVIGVLGDPEVLTELRKICTGKTIKEIPILAKEIEAPEKLIGYKIIYLAKTQNFLVNDILGLIGNEKILLVTEGKNKLKQGADINMLKPADKLAFEVNKESIKNKGLKVPSELMLLAVNIDKHVF
jgi:hypothetical protein